MEGVVIASDQTLEWLLPWWWNCYLQTNHHPVAFIDLGLSMGMKEWCKKRGKHIRLYALDFAETVDPTLAKQWEEDFGTKFWESRNAWFKKPLACLLSPFEKSLWIDVDCEVKESIAPLFALSGSIAMAKDQIAPKGDYPIYNSGVIAFHPKDPILSMWSRYCLENHSFFRGDQEAFSHMVYKENIKVAEIPSSYNWSRSLEEGEKAKIIHWHGYYGKAALRIKSHQIDI